MKENVVSDKVLMYAGSAPIFSDDGEVPSRDEVFDAAVGVIVNALSMEQPAQMSAMILKDKLTFFARHWRQAVEVH